MADLIDREPLLKKMWPDVNIGAEIIATDNPADSTELHKVSSRPKSEQYVCISCGNFCYYPHCKAGIQYRFCPNCGKKVRGYA